MPGTTAEEPAAPAGKETADGIGSVVAGNNRFTFNLYRELANDSAGDNTFFSPYSHLVGSRNHL